MLAVLLALTACGADEESTRDTPVADEPASTYPFPDLPPEELYGASPEDNLWSPRYELEVFDLPAGWNEARFAIISDFQLGLWERNDTVAAAAVGAALAAQPDVVLLIGDYIARGEDVDALRRVLEPLRGTTTIAVLGDRDIRSDSIAERIVATLREVGIQVLRNRSVPIDRDGDTIYIAGLDPEILNETWNDQEYILATVGPARRTPILLTHVAPMVTRAPTNRYPIVISGNTFCGTVEVAGTPRISWLRNEALPSASIEGAERLFRVRGSTLLVTCGIGYGFIPLRFGAAPEVPILTVVGFGAETGQESETGAAADSLLQQLEASRADTATN